MLYDLVELVLDHFAKRRGWTWQRYVIVPFITAATLAILLYLAVISSRWWLPALFASMS